jgi:hypothetical protein
LTTTELFEIKIFTMSIIEEVVLLLEGKHPIYQFLVIDFCQPLPGQLQEPIE